MKFYEVGGAVRDEFLGLRSKDVDFAVDMTDDFSSNLKLEDMFEVMRAKLISEGFEEFVCTPEFQTTRCKVPAGHPLLARTNVADFVLCRVEGPYTDGRHPDWVKIGNLDDDLARRDFTMNAIAKDIDGNIYDPHNGVQDIAAREIVFVGDPEQRIREDGIRIIRAMRFTITKDMRMSPETFDCISTDFAAECLDRIRSRETLRDELEKMFSTDSYASFKLLEQFPKLLPVLFDKDNIRLSATMKKGNKKNAG